MTLAMSQSADYGALRPIWTLGGGSRSPQTPAPPPDYVFERPSTAWSPVDGLLVEYTPDIFRPVTDGYLFEPFGTTNLVPQPRDLTHGSWTRSNMIALATAGADGAAGSGTRLTTMADNGYAQVSITSAAPAHVASLRLRRVTGYDDWWLSVDGGTTRWGLTPYLIDGQWWRAIMPAQFGSDPVLRLWCSAAGNTIDVDFVQVEAGFRATSECVGTRSPELIRVTNGPVIDATLLAETALGVTAHNRIGEPVINAGTATITWLAGQGPYGAEQYWPELQLVLS